MRAALFVLGFVAPFVGGAPASAQTGDVDDFRTLTVLQVHPAANEIRVRETGTQRVRTLQLDENSVISGGGGGTGGSITLREIQAGDTIRVRDVAGSASDRVHADRIQVLATPPDRPASGGMRVEPSDRPVRSPSALDPPAGEPGALGTQRPGDPSALDPPAGEPGALGTRRPGDPSALDPQADEPGALGTQRPGDPSAVFPEAGGSNSGTGAGSRRGTGESGGAGSSGGSGTGGSGGSSGGGP